ncbi:cyclase family protein [Flavisericum labens]|uniref:cyclase family protein n=1 Tax=Flavisericum labens TaxID=3377112 RepID=UPI00387B9A9D
MKTQLLFILSFPFLLIGCVQKQTASSDSVKPIQIKTSERKLVDLSHAYSDKTVYWVTAKEFKLDTVFKGHTDKGFYYCANNFSTAEHGGTHIDAPIHFSEKGQTVDEIPLEKLIGPAIKIDISSDALNNSDYLIKIDDFLAWENKEKIKIPKGSIILLETGFSKYYPDKAKYMGTAQRGEDAVKKLHFPGLSKEAAKWLVEQRNINAIGIDTPSIDYGQSEYFESHVILLSHNIPAFENLTNLDKLPNSGFEIVALPMKIQGGSGAPLRIVAIIN